MFYFIVGSDSQRREQSNGGRKISLQFIENMELKDTLTQTKMSQRVNFYLACTNKKELAEDVSLELESFHAVKATSTEVSPA